MHRSIVVATAAVLIGFGLAAVASRALRDPSRALDECCAPNVQTASGNAAETHSTGSPHDDLAEVRAILERIAKGAALSEDREALSRLAKKSPKALAEIAGDPTLDLLIRRIAATTLASDCEASAGDLIVALLKSDCDVRVKTCLLSVAGRLRLVDAVESVCGLVSGPDVAQDVLRPALTCLGEIGDKRARAFLVVLLKNGAWEPHYAQVALSLARHGGTEEAAAVLNRWLEVSKPRSARSDLTDMSHGDMIEALSAFNPAAHAYAVRDALPSAIIPGEAGSAYRNAMVATLMLNAAPETKEVLRDIAMTGCDALVQRQAVAALANIPRAGVGEDLLEIMAKSKDAAVAYRAARGLEKVDDLPSKRLVEAFDGASSTGNTPCAVVLAAKLARDEELLRTDPLLLGRMRKQLAALDSRALVPERYLLKVRLAAFDEDPVRTLADVFEEKAGKLYVLQSPLLDATNRPGMVPLLCSAVASGQVLPRHRLECIERLATSGRVAASIPTLLDVVAEDSNEDLSLKCAQVIAKNGTEAQIHELRQRIASIGDSRRRAILEAAIQR